MRGVFCTEHPQVLECKTHLKSRFWHHFGTPKPRDDIICDFMRSTCHKVAWGLASAAQHLQQVSAAFSHPRPCLELKGTEQPSLIRHKQRVDTFLEKSQIQHLLCCFTLVDVLNREADGIPFGAKSSGPPAFRCSKHRFNEVRANRRTWHGMIPYIIVHACVLGEVDVVA